MLIDTSAIIAYFSDSEAQHQDVVTAVTLLLSNGNALGLLDSVLEETLAVVRKRISKKQAVHIAKNLVDRPVMKLITLSEDIVLQATALFVKHRGKYSYVDCSLVASAKNLHESTILTLDRDFRELGLKSIP